MSGLTVVKWHIVRPEAVRRVGARIEEVRSLGPVRVPRLVRHGFVASRDGLRLEFERVHGRPLNQLLRSGALDTAERARLARVLSESLSLWQLQGFVHGDLSLRNILVGEAAVWFIDWIVDPESWEATPAFASPVLGRGHRTQAADSYAMSRILCILSP